jgi:hypothetical protein
MRASDMKRIMTLTLTIAGFVGTSLALAGEQQPVKEQTPVQQMDTAPGPAHLTVDGQVTKIEGEVYTVQSASAGYLDSGIKQNEIRMYVGQGTKKINGDKKVGDKIRAEVTFGGFANSIQ